MPRTPAVKAGDLSALARVMTKLPFPGPDPALRKRQMLAAFCRLLAAQFDEPPGGNGDGRRVDNRSANHGAHPGARPLDETAARNGDGDASADPERVGATTAPPPPPLSPRLAQTLERLLAGDSEKEAAAQLGVSPHTVHVYVKALYRHFDVCSRGELFARFVRTNPHRPAVHARAAASATR